MTTHRVVRQPKRRRRALLAVGAVATAALLVPTVLVATRQSGEAAACSQRPRVLHVVAAAEIAPVLAEAADSAGLGACWKVDVAARAPEAVAADLRRGVARAPDVWVPDSTMWVDAAGAVAAAPGAPSVARSSVVLAVSEQVAHGLGWPRRALSLHRVLTSRVQPGPRLVLGDPQQSATTVAALLAVRAATGSRADLAATVRAAQVGPVGAQGLAAAAAGDVVPVSERELLAYNETAGASRRVAVGLGPSGLALDYPFVVLAGGSAERAVAAKVFSALGTEAAREALTAAGFSSPATGKPSAAPSRAEVGELTQAVQRLRLPSRLLAVFDVSGSMAMPMPGARGASRLSWALHVADRGLSLFPDEAEVGLWVFATRLRGAQDFLQLAPVQQLGTMPDGGTGRERIAQALGRVRVVPGGGTGLYDTTLAAVRTVRAGWDPGKVNSVVVLTDGRNHDAGGIGLARLLKTLRGEEKARPVPVITIGLGRASDDAALLAISLATGGQSYTAQDARQLQRVFLDAIGSRLCGRTC